MEWQKKQNFNIKFSVFLSDIWEPWIHIFAKSWKVPHHTKPFAIWYVGIVIGANYVVIIVYLKVSEYEMVNVLVLTFSLLYVGGMDSCKDFLWRQNCYNQTTWNALWLEHFQNANGVLSVSGDE